MQENIILSKVIGFTPEKLKARHLLIATNNSTEEKVITAKRKLADSILNIINKDNFTELVTKFSEDPGSKETGGLYEDFLKQIWYLNSVLLCNRTNRQNWHSKNKFWIPYN